ncbi:hypothetical protein F4859DRAFT_517444 [Xylaria cf. heliscus]|nr:hypothetical protein F4859DRAFT_517444 [Xylaria cf. heliscus]
MEEGGASALMGARKGNKRRPAEQQPEIFPRCGPGVDYDGQDLVRVFAEGGHTGRPEWWLPPGQYIPTVRPTFRHASDLEKRQHMKSYGKTGLEDIEIFDITNMASRSGWVANFLRFHNAEHLDYYIDNMIGHAFAPYLAASKEMHRSRASPDKREVKDGLVRYAKLYKAISEVDNANNYHTRTFDTQPGVLPVYNASESKSKYMTTIQIITIHRIMTNDTLRFTEDEHTADLPQYWGFSLENWARGKVMLDRTMSRRSLGDYQFIGNRRRAKHTDVVRCLWTVDEAQAQRLGQETSLEVPRPPASQGGHEMLTPSDSMASMVSEDGDSLAAPKNLLGITPTEHEADWAEFASSTAEQQVDLRIKHFLTMESAAAVLLRRPNEYVSSLDGMGNAEYMDLIDALKKRHGLVQDEEGPSDRAGPVMTPGIQQRATQNVLWWDRTTSASGEAKELPSNEQVYPVSSISEAGGMIAEAGSGVKFDHHDTVDMMHIFTRLCRWPYLALHGNDTWTKRSLVDLLAVRLRVVPTGTEERLARLPRGRAGEAHRKPTLILTRAGSVASTFKQIKLISPNLMRPIVFGSQNDDITGELSQQQTTVASVKEFYQSATNNAGGQEWVGTHVLISSFELFKQRCFDIDNKGIDELSDEEKGRMDSHIAGTPWSSWARNTDGDADAAADAADAADAAAERAPIVKVLSILPEADVQWGLVVVDSPVAEEIRDTDWHKMLRGLRYESLLISGRKLPTGNPRTMLGYLLVAPGRATTEEGAGAGEEARGSGLDAEAFAETCEGLGWDVTGCVEAIEYARDQLLVRRLRTTAIIKHRRCAGEADNAKEAGDMFEDPNVDVGLDEKGNSTAPVIRLHDVALVPDLKSRHDAMLVQPEAAEAKLIPMLKETLAFDVGLGELSMPRQHTAGLSRTLEALRSLQYGQKAGKGKGRANGRDFRTAEEISKVVEGIKDGGLHLWYRASTDPMYPMPRTRAAWLRWLCDGSPVLVSVLDALSRAYPTEGRFLILVPTQPLIFLWVVNMLRLLGFNTEAMLPRQQATRKKQLFLSFNKKRSQMQVLVTRMEEATEYFFTLACNTAISTYIPSSAVMLKRLADLMIRPWGMDKGEVRQARIMFYPVEMSDDDAKRRLLWRSFAQWVFKENPAVAWIRGALGRMAAYEIARLCCGPQQEHMGWLELEEASGQPVSISKSDRQSISQFFSLVGQVTIEALVEVKAEAPLPASGGDDVLSADMAMAATAAAAAPVTEANDGFGTGFSYFENEAPIQDDEFLQMLNTFEFNIEQGDVITYAEHTDMVPHPAQTPSYERITMRDLLGGFCVFQGLEDWQVVSLSWLEENAKEQFIDPTKLPAAFEQPEERCDGEAGPKVERKVPRKRGRPQKRRAAKRQRPS